MMMKSPFSFTKRIAPQNWKAKVLCKSQLSDQITKLTLLPFQPMVDHNNNNNNNNNSTDYSNSNHNNSTIGSMKHSPVLEFKFYPGQWVDFYPLPTWNDHHHHHHHRNKAAIIGNDQQQQHQHQYHHDLNGIAGFSMINSSNSPHHFHPNELEFAIKLSNHRMTQFIHSDECIAGETVMNIRGPDGQFMYLQPELTTNDNGGDGDSRLNYEKYTRVNLIGGGIGITPMLSIWNHVRHLSHPLPNTRVKMLYGARRAEDLVFWRELEESSRACEHARMQVYYNVSDEENDIGDHVAGPSKDNMSSGQLDRSLLEKVFFAEDDEGGDNLRNGLFYVCGPDPMIQGIVQSLSDIGVGKEQLIYERW